MPHKILYTADVHGNEVQYKKLIDYAIQISADSVIIGGDIAPKGDSTGKCMQKFREKGTIHAFIDMQKEFLENELPQLVSPLKEKLPQSKLYILMGNDDCSINMDVLQKNDGKYFHLIHGKRMQLNNDFDIAGYSCVPITPFGIKDWEKFDLSNPPAHVRSEYEKRKYYNYVLDGYKSTCEGLVRYSFKEDLEQKDSIQKDLSEEIFTKNPHKTVYVVHTPPNNTCLDMLFDKRHVGSFALRQFIEQFQPYLTLHGHIHETVSVSGKFKEIIKNSVSISPGNHNVGSDLAVLVFDLYDLRNVERRIIWFFNLILK